MRGRARGAGGWRAWTPREWKQGSTVEEEGVMASEKRAFMGYSHACAWGSWVRGALAVVAGVFACASALVVPACERAGGGAVDLKAAEAMRVVVGVPPLVGVVKAIVPGAEVRSLVPPGQSVHGYELRPSDVKALGEAHLLVGVGLGIDASLERYVKERVRPGQRVVWFANEAGVEAAGHDHHDHQGHNHDHGDGSADPHLWLDPALVVKLSSAVAKEAAALVPEGVGREAGVKAIEASRAALEVRVRALDERYVAELAPLRGRAIVTHHNSFQRMADRYGLKVASVIREMEASEATPGRISATVEAIRKEGVRAVFFEPAYDAGAAKRIAEAAGVGLGRLDPESSEDWFALMEGNLASLVEHLGGGGGQSGDQGGAERGATGAPGR